MSGLPAMSIPCGFSQGLPVGMQLIGQAFDEQMILNVGYAYQSATAWHLEKPAFIGGKA
jgi:aspartyl-tRNA(Asn)/glutamyl-tRNA(Gln) amidotransferase subunit A